eukprot:NODE_2014_length_1013_cov_145.996868.p9 GENE.NODE_2014_length_1013_cov_145.996868~~NODE_2014_length_1013_cov_145.996868.p9  ORF type:complete len:79 (-),score=18.87 NODE_2014_length_1013_cov_145.996868:759-995(-)
MGGMMGGCGCMGMPMGGCGCMGMGMPGMSGAQGGTTQDGNGGASGASATSGGAVSKAVPAPGPMRAGGSGGSTRAAPY